MEYKRRKVIFGIGFWVWLAGIMVFSVLPKIPVINPGGIKHPLFSYGYIQHFVCYFIWTALFFLWKINKNYKIKWLNFVFFLVGAVFISIGGEAIQEFIAGRSFNMKDFYSNLAGIFLGVVLYYAFLIARQKRIYLKGTSINY